MMILIRLALLAIALYMYVSFFLVNADKDENAILYKIYMFLFIFLFNFLFQFFSHINSATKCSINDFIENSINHALIAVIAFDVYNDLTHVGFYKEYDTQQKNLMLVLLIVGFMSAIKIIELLIYNN